MSVQDPQHASSAVIVIDDDDEEQAGPSTRSSAGPPRKRQRTAAPTPSSRRRPLSGMRAAQHVSSSRQAPLQQAEAVIDLTSYTAEDAAGDLFPATKQKQKQAMPVLIQPDEAAQLSAAAPEPQCPICMDPMKAMACGPCGHVFCDTCIRAAVKAQKKCPTCRKTMAMKAIHRVYLDRR
ncbi:g12487 [Coccomyxa viridis]|uniref:G12487 protein n=1 Tax=Coccomyxa viridis TaxID=1274662 RepID=A0ABP1GAG1_9CHLO